MQPGNMDAHHQMRLLFGQMDSPLMMPMQMPFLIPTTASAASASGGSTKTSEKEKEKDRERDKDKAKTKTPEPTTLPGYSMPGLSPYPYGMFPYTPGVPPMQMPLMLPLGANPFMPYNLFPYPGMINPKDIDAKSGTALLKELSNNSKKAQAGKNSPGPTRSSHSKHGSSFDLGSETRPRNSPLSKPVPSDAKRFSDVVQSAIMEGFKDTEKRKEKDTHKVTKPRDSPLDFTTRSRPSPVRESHKKPKERPRHDDYLHLLQKTSLHHKQVKEKDKPNTAKLKIEALIDFGQKKPTLSNLKLNLEKELEENLKTSTFSAGSERSKFSPDTTFGADERRNWFRSETKERRTPDQRHEFRASDHYREYDPSRLTRDMGLYPGEFPKHSTDSLNLSSERDLENSGVLRGEAHQVRLARYNAQRLRMNSFYKSDNYTYVEQVEPDSTGDLHEEAGEVSPRLTTDQRDQDRKTKALSDCPKDTCTDMEPPVKRPRIESPLARPATQVSSLQDLKVDSSAVVSDTDLSPPTKDNTVRDKILSYIKSRSKRKRDISPIPPLIPDMPIQNLKLQPGLSIVDSWKHQLAPSIETTAQATLEEMVLDHWRKSLATEYCQVSPVTKPNEESSDNGDGHDDAMDKSDKGRYKELDLEPGEVYRPDKMNVPPRKTSTLAKDTSSMSSGHQSISHGSHDESSTHDATPETCTSKIISLEDATTKDTVTDKTSSSFDKLPTEGKSNSPFSILDIMGNMAKSIPCVKNESSDQSMTDIESTKSVITSAFGSMVCDAKPFSDIRGSPDYSNGSTSEAEKTHPVNSSKPYLSFSDSDRSDISQKCKKQKREDDANTLSAEFALEAVKALDCIATLTPTALSDQTEPHTAGERRTQDEAAVGNPSLSFGQAGVKSAKKHNRRIKKHRKKLKSFSKKNVLSKQMKPPGDPDLSALACTDISNVDLLSAGASTGLFSDASKLCQAPLSSVHKRGPGRPAKHGSGAFSFGDKRRKPGRPPKVKVEQQTPSAVTTEDGVKIEGQEVVPDCTVVEQPQRKKRSPLFYGCNYNDTLLLSALRIKLPKSEKKFKKKRVKCNSKQKVRQDTATTVPEVKKKQNVEMIPESRPHVEESPPDLLDNVSLSTLKQTKECSVLLKDVSSYLTEEKNVNVKETPFSERTESEKENKEDNPSGAEVRSESPVRVFSRPQVAKRSTPWKTKQASVGNRLVLRRDPSKNGYFVKYSDAMIEETERLGPNVITCDDINNVVKSVVCNPLDQESERMDSAEIGFGPTDFQQEHTCIDEIFEGFSDSIDSECFKCEFFNVEKKPSLVDRFKATLLDEACGRKRRGISQRSRSTDDLTSIKASRSNTKPKKPVTAELDFRPFDTPASPSEREERVSALKERLKLQQAAVAEIRWKMLESGAQSE